MGEKNTGYRREVLGRWYGRTENRFLFLLLLYAESALAARRRLYEKLASFLGLSHKS